MEPHKIGDGAPVVDPLLGRIPLSDSVKARCHRVLPGPAASFLSWMRDPHAAVRRRHPALWGTLRRHDGFSPSYAEGRGRALDRFYIERFLEVSKPLIHGRALEVTDTSYTERFGDEITTMDALDIDADNPAATIVVDLCDPDCLPESAFDVVIATQTVHILLDPLTGMRNLYRSLAPGGTLLVTVPCASPSSTALPTDSWRFLPTGLERLSQDACGEHAIIEVEGYGNKVTAAAFMLGLAWEDLSDGDFAPNDPQCPLIAAVRITKPPLV